MRTLVLDRVFREVRPGQLTFTPSLPASDEDVAHILATVRASMGLEPEPSGFVPKLDAVLADVRDRYNTSDLGEEGRNEARQPAWHLWRTRAPYLWLVGPAEHGADRVDYEPLEFEPLSRLSS